MGTGSTRCGPSLVKLLTIPEMTRGAGADSPRVIATVILFICPADRDRDFEYRSVRTRIIVNW
ncbi:MAG: hypothetical protein DCC65_11920 [Planctomycetota bacterium]|nr:MAG: hypothetical protein DCC65_11920 [Planctomycetota bacterium]